MNPGYVASHCLSDFTFSHRCSNQTAIVSSNTLTPVLSEPLELAIPLWKGLEAPDPHLLAISHCSGHTWLKDLWNLKPKKISWICNFSFEPIGSLASSFVLPSYHSCTVLSTDTTFVLLIDRIPSYSLIFCICFFCIKYFPHSLPH
jgi:hypothetical protein